MKKPAPTVQPGDKIRINVGMVHLFDENQDHESVEVTVMAILEDGPVKILVLASE